MSTPDPTRPDQTRRLDRTQEPERISYTEDYSGASPDVGREATRVAPQGRGVVAPGIGASTAAGGLPLDPEDDEGPRTVSVPATILISVAAALLGAVLVLLLLPEDAPVVLDDIASQQALADAQAEQDATQGMVEELQLQLAERDARIAQLEAQQAGDAAAADQALADREAAVNQREAAVGTREAEVATREQAVAAREDAVAAREAAVDAGEGGGVQLPDLPTELPGDLPDVQLPELDLDSDQAQSMLDRFLDRVQSLLQ